MARSVPADVCPLHGVPTSRVYHEVAPDRVSYEVVCPECHGVRKDAN